MANTTASGTPVAALVFESTTFDVVTRDNQPWLRGPQIGGALGYAADKANDAITKLYDRNIAEFTDSMTALVKLSTSGGEQTVRCFSLRGAHLLGMLARTAKAIAFRKWVLDILDAHVAQLNHSTTDTLIPSEQQTLSELVHRRVAGLDAAMQGKALAEIWSRLHNKFRVAKYNQLPRAQLSDAIAYVMQMEIKALGKAPQPEQLGELGTWIVQQVHHHTDRYLSRTGHGNAASVRSVVKAHFGAKPAEIPSSRLPELLDVMEGFAADCYSLHYACKFLEEQLVESWSKQPCAIPQAIRQLMDMNPASTAPGTEMQQIRARAQLKVLGLLN